MPNPWVPTTDKLDLKHLGKLAEELGELSSAVARCIIQGFDENHPVTGKPNKEWLEEEIADVYATMSHVQKHFGLDYNFIRNRETNKINYLAEWHRMEDEDQ